MVASALCAPVDEQEIQRIAPSVVKQSFRIPRLSVRLTDLALSRAAGPTWQDRRRACSRQSRRVSAGPRARRVGCCAELGGAPLISVGVSSASNTCRSQQACRAPCDIDGEDLLLQIRISREERLRADWPS